MIGSKLWTTGIRVCFDGKYWLVDCKFYDDGFCQQESIQGVLSLRYKITDPDIGITILYNDLHKLGFIFKPDPPQLYAESIWEGASYPLPVNWKETLEPIANKLNLVLCEP